MRKQLFPWVVVMCPGQDEQRIIAKFEQYKLAAAYVKALVGEHIYDVMKQQKDGSLTTEF